MTVPHAFTCPNCTRRYRLVRRFADTPAGNGEVALAGADGRQAARLLRAAKDEGAARLTQLARPAVQRLLRGGELDGRLFSEGELADLADQIAAVNSTSELLGRARVRLRHQRIAGGVKLFADDPTPFKGTFAPAPIRPLAPRQALDYYRSLVPTVSVRDAVAWAGQQLRTAFTLAGQVGETVMRKVRSVIEAARAAGGSIVADVNTILNAVGVGPRNRGYSDLVFRTTAMSAYIEGGEDEVRQPDLIGAFPAWRWLSVVDQNSRPHHAERHGLYYPIRRTFQDERGRDIAQTANCRCVPLYLAAAEVRGLQRRGVITFAEMPTGTLAFCGGPGSGRPGPCPGDGGRPRGPVKTEAIKSAVRSGAAKMAAGARSLHARAKARIDQILGRVPESVKAPLSNAYHATHSSLMSVNNSARALATSAARESGMSPKGVARLSRVLAAVDLAVPGALGAGLAATGNIVAGKLAAYVPVGSMSYLMYSTARRPRATLRAAGKLLAETAPGQVKGAWRFALGSVAHPLTRQAVAAHAEAPMLNVAAELAKRLAGLDEAAADWYEALFFVALDETKDVGEAMALADRAYAVGPPPDDGVAFASKGSGGSGKGRRRGGGGVDTFDPVKHPRGGKGQFRPTPGAPKPAPKTASGPVKSVKSKFIGQRVGAQEHKAADQVSASVAKWVRGKTEEQTSAGGQSDKKPFDVRVKNHDIEVKSLLKGGKQSISVHDDALLRKVDHINANQRNVFHTVVVDKRKTYDGGKFAGNYSGHEVYYKRGSGRYSLADMHPVKNAAELRRLIRRPAAQLPKAARGSLPPPPPLERLRATAAKASESRKVRDKARKERNRDLLQAQARARAAAKKVNP